jgi:hypothetical protein
MIHRLLIPLLGAGLLLAATAGSAFAKCEGTDPRPEFCSDVIVDLKVSGGGIFHAGTEEAVAINVSMGEQPFDALGVVLTFARVADGTAVRVPATASPVAGQWTADVLLPDGGSWTVVAQVVTADGAEYRIPMQVVQVAAPPDLPPATPATPPVTPTTPALPIALLLAGLAAAALAGLAIRGRSRRTVDAPTGAAASVSADRA